MGWALGLSPGYKAIVASGILTPEAELPLALVDKASELCIVHFKRWGKVSSFKKSAHFGGILPLHSYNQSTFPVQEKLMPDPFCNAKVKARLLRSRPALIWFLIKFLFTARGPFLLWIYMHIVIQDILVTEEKIWKSAFSLIVLIKTKSLSPLQHPVLVSWLT